jgi:hypothetical protein
LELKFVKGSGAVDGVGSGETVGMGAGGVRVGAAGDAVGGDAVGGSGRKGVEVLFIVQMMARVQSSCIWSSINCKQWYWKANTST